MTACARNIWAVPSLLLLAACGQSISDEIAISDVKNCHAIEDCNVHPRHHEYPSEAKSGPGGDLICKRGGDLRVVEREKYDGGEVILMDCTLESKLVSKATIWNHFSGGVLIDVVPCETDICTYFRPI